ncbi:MAG: MltA domain-containing protein, partial [Pseudomonadota bacterium]|nr:MltA domain-containing protein [Pseudomonadota bacterium]
GRLRGRSVIGRVEGGRMLPYYRRADIQQGSIGHRAKVLAWVDDRIDAFLLHVQGSGRILLPDGDILRIGYAGNNGHGYVSIGRVLIKKGELSAGQAGWTQIRRWIEMNPQKTDALLAENPRYIFFREILGDGPIGAQGVALTPRRSLAVDRRYIPLGAPLWLDTVWPGGGNRPLRRLMVAQDTGSAIKGPIRGDFFWGYGQDALAEAGRMKSRGNYYLLLPKSTEPTSS